jgi:hypothetical protein
MLETRRIRKLADWYSANALHLYSGDLQFESHLRQAVLDSFQPHSWRVP